MSFVSLIRTTPLNAQTDFFFSDKAIGEGAVNANLTLEMAPGEAGTLYVYYSTNGPADSDIDTGAFLDVLTGTSGMLEFISAETHEFDITFVGTPLAVRWGDSFGTAAEVSAESIDELGAFTIFSGEGILEGHNGQAGLIDQGYDIFADAFLFATIEFRVVDDSELSGSSVEILAATGAGGIMNGFQNVDASFGLATINIETALLIGDVNSDGIVSDADIWPFVLAIANLNYVEAADINSDGSVNLRDIPAFVGLLMGK